MLILLAALGCGDTPQPVTPETHRPEPPRLEVGATRLAEPQADPTALTDIDCDAVSSPPVDDATCITGTLSCGDSIVGHTEGGVQRFDTRFYEKFFCTPATTNHDSGGERVYVLEMPEGKHHAVVELTTPCADLDLAVMRYEGDGCPDHTSTIDVCDMNRKKGRQGEKVRIASKDRSRWLVVVEGVDDQDGAFGLKVTCGEGF